MSRSPLPAPPDFVPLAFAGTTFGILLGTAIMTGFLLANRALIHPVPAGSTTPDLNQPAALALFIAPLVTLLIPAIVTWNLLGPIPSTFRRGGLAMVAAFGGLMVSLANVPLNQFLGIRGMVGLLVLVLTGMLLLARRLSRLPVPR